MLRPLKRKTKRLWPASHEATRCPDAGRDEGSGMSGRDREFHDGRDIALESEPETNYWLKYLDTTRDELYAAVSAVGVSAEKVKQYLAEKRRTQERDD